MSQDLQRTANHARFLPGQRAGHYESYFQRANHPTRPLAFWIRYTLFSPANHPERGLGELWAIVFDGETGNHVAVKHEVPIARARFERGAFDVRVEEATHALREAPLATLGPLALRGEAASGGHRVAWDLRYRGTEAPLIFYPDALYEAPLPSAKLLVGVPMAAYDGTLRVDDHEIAIEGWTGSQNHNWGSQHTDHYAWGQVAGFDGDGEGSFLEVATARIKVAGVWTPFMTPAVLRHRGVEHRAVTPSALVRARGSFGLFDWRFSFEAPSLRAEGTIKAAREDFVGLAYANPPGGVKHCLNSKIATCALTLHHADGRTERLDATRRAAFEILTDPSAHGVPIVA